MIKETKAHFKNNQLVVQEYRNNKFSPFISKHDDIEYYIKPKSHRNNYSFNDTSIYDKESYKNKYRRFKMNELREEFGTSLQEPSRERKQHQAERIETTNTTNSDGPTFITGRPEPQAPSTLYRKKSLKEATAKLATKYHTAHTLELAKCIIKDKKKPEMRLAAFSDYRYVPNWMEIVDLRKINKTNFIKQMILEEDTTLALTMDNKERQFKEINTDMDHAREMIKESMKKAEHELKIHTETNNASFREFQHLDHKCKNLETENNLLQAEIRNMETEINTLSSCYDFLLELVGPERQKVIRAEIDVYWTGKFKSYKNQLKNCDLTGVVGDYEIYLAKKNYLINNYKVYDFMPKIEIHTEERQEKLLQQYRQVNLDIQEFLINADEYYSVIQTVDQNTAEREKTFNNEINKQNGMYKKKLNYLKINGMDKAIEEKDTQSESDRKLITIYNEILEYLSLNAPIFTKGAKKFKSKEITYKDAIDICLSSEQILEEYINIIKYEKYHKLKDEESLIKNFNLQRKQNKNDNSKTVELKVYEEYSDKITSARNVFSKLSGLKKAIRPVFRSRPNDRVANQVSNEGSDGRWYVRELQMVDYLDKE